jgi:hypothetical protein
MYDNPSSFLISVSSPVGNYIIPSSHYTVSQSFRTITFNNTIKANTVLEFTQLATVYPFLSNTRFTYLSSVSGSFKTLSAVDSKFDSLLVSNLTALSAIINIIDITQYELSGFNSTGNFNVSGSLAVANNLYVKGAITTDTATGDLTSSNIYVKNALSAYNLNIGNNVNIGNNLNVGTATSKGQLTVVGVGQSYNNSPAATLSSIDTNGALGNALVLGDSGVAVGNGGTLIFAANNTNWNFAAIHGNATDATSNSTGDIGFYTRYSPYDTALSGIPLYLKSTGQVGINNVTAPNNTLTVAGTISATGALTVSNTINSTGKLTVTNDISSTGTVFTNYLSSRYIDLVHGTPFDGYNPMLAIGEIGDGANGTTIGAFSGINVIYDESANKLSVQANFFGAPLLTAVTITTAANVGINTLSPTSKLTVVGDISATGAVTTMGITPMIVPVAVGITALSGFNFTALLNTPQASAVVYTVPAGKIFMPTGLTMIFDGATGNGPGNGDTLPAIRVYTDRKNGTDISNFSTPQANSGTTFFQTASCPAYFHQANTFTSSSPKTAGFAGDNIIVKITQEYSKIGAGVTSLATLSGRVIVTGNLINWG